MPKDTRLVVRMSEDMRAWISQQATSLEMDDSAYVRLLIAERRQGFYSPVTYAPNGDDLKGFAQDVPAEPSNDAVPHEGAAAAPVDLDALVDSQFAAADAAGMTKQVDDDYGGFEHPQATVRALGQRRSWAEGDKKRWATRA